MFELITIEALYQMFAAQQLTDNRIVSRGQFLRTNFAVVTSVDGVLAVLKCGLALNLLILKPAQPKGLRSRIYPQ